MPEIDRETQERLKKVGKSLADLARAIGETRDRVSAHILGYRHLNPILRRKINNQLNEWEKK